MKYQSNTEPVQQQTLRLSPHLNIGGPVNPVSSLSHGFLIHKLRVIEHPGQWPRSAGEDQTTVSHRDVCPGTLVPLSPQYPDGRKQWVLLEVRGCVDTPHQLQDKGQQRAQNRPGESEAAVPWSRSQADSAGLAGMEL